jgi:hypothetical protein
VTAREPSEYAGQTVKIRADVIELGEAAFRVEDWWVNVAGVSWMDAVGNPAALRYATRAAGRTPIDDEVLYGKVDGLGYLVHVSEIEATA